MSIELNDFQTFLGVAFVILGGIATLGKAHDVLKSWLKPSKTIEQRVTKVEAKLENDNKRLKSMEDGNKAICRGVLALLNHEITGNSIEKLKEAQTGINDYLINR